jgi:hypothetical protein
MCLLKVLNDLMASGIEAGEYSIVLDEMQEMCLIEVEDEHDEIVLSCQSPVLAEIAFDVSTPAQVTSIIHALINRLESYALNDFRISLVMADLEYQLNTQNARVKSLLKQGLCILAQKSQIERWSPDLINKWKLTILDEIEEAGYSAEQIFPDDCERPLIDESSVPASFCSRLLMMKEYSPPMVLGPMSRTIAVICSTTFHEFGFLSGYNHEKVEKFVSDRKSAIHRYIQQTEIIEKFFDKYAISCNEDELEAERMTVMDLLVPAENEAAVKRKVTQILDQISPSYISSRTKRMRNAVARMREEAVPDFIMHADIAIRRAYAALKGPKSGLKAVQEALMILATLNWKANRAPYYHSCLPYTTVASIRNKIFNTQQRDTSSPISDDSQEAALDFEGFLVTTALLDGVE